MKALLVPIGSAGDVHPFMAIGQALHRLGHEVELLANPVFEAQIGGLGFGFTPIGTAQQYQDTLAHPKVWHPIDGLGVMWRSLIKHTLIPVYERLTVAAKEGPCVVLASPAAFGARAAQARHGIPVVTAYTAATQLRSCQDPLTMAHWQVPRWMPQVARRAAWRALDRYKLEPMARPALATLFAQAGMDRPKGSMFGQWMHSPLAGVTLFPDWFARAASDWPTQVEQTGFVFFDGDQNGDLDPPLHAFLEAGSPPVVFMPGTAARDTGAFFRAALQTCRQLGVRGVLLGHDAQAVAASANATAQNDVLAAPYAPFGSLLPRCSALVHHGGIGSLAQALRAGLPQLLVPKGFDQFDNALRVRTLGLGTSLPRSDASLDGLAPALTGLLQDIGMLERCRQYAQRLQSREPLDKICALMERVT